MYIIVCRAHFCHLPGLGQEGHSPSGTSGSAGTLDWGPMWLGSQFTYHHQCPPDAPTPLLASNAPWWPSEPLHPWYPCWPQHPLHPCHPNAPETLHPMIPWASYTPCKPPAIPTPLPPPMSWHPYSLCWPQCPLSPLMPHTTCQPPLHTLLAPDTPYTPTPLTPPMSPETPTHHDTPELQCPWAPNTPTPLLVPWHPLSQNRNLVVKSGTTSGDHDMLSACGSGCCLVTCTPPPPTPPGRGIYCTGAVLHQVKLAFGEHLGQIDLFVWEYIWCLQLQ